ncbi:Eukaryotic translation initiation factor 3 subunit E [Zea mays]|uniref:Eukaryotic translation initiation factor 3 subunit E n=1 Tax=Zea mays TaxID=4577 RepID=B4FLR2_MAIZE|nr:unknown [Zea mays]AQK53631.1 Eukaryotic translation initiation factor 3 subunit E [Zea mays]
MIILASVISSTVSNVLLGARPAFIVPAYELKSAAGWNGCYTSFSLFSPIDFSTASL